MLEPHYGCKYVEVILHQPIVLTYALTNGRSDIEHCAHDIFF